MDHLPQLTEDNSSEAELNNIITLTGQYYQREIDSFLSQSNSLSQGDRKKDLKNFLDFSKLNFRKILRILAYSKDMLNDATNIYNYQNKIRMIHDERRSISQNFENQTNDDISMLKLPTVQPEITSYLMNQGNYNLANINVRGQVNFDSINSDVYETMNRTLQKKLCLSILPEEGLEYKINEGLLKITGPSFLLELTLFCDPRTGDYNWFLLNFEHKLQKFQNLEKKIGDLNNEISKLYVEDKRDQEIYTIAFLVHKIKYLYSRKKLKSIIKKAESLRSQLESLGSEEVFDINQKTIAKDKIFFEIIYWKNSLLHSLNPQHRFNCLIFQLSNLSIFNFIEQYLKSPFELFSGLSEDEVTCVYHEPCLPQPEIISQIQRLVGNANSLPINQNSYQAIYKILLFQTSKKIRLPGLSLDSNFFEIFKEVKNLFKVYQLFQYFCILYKKLKKSDLENIQLFLSNRDGVKSNNIAELNDVFIGIDIAGKILSVSVDLTNGGVDFNFEFLPKDVEIHKAKFNEILRQNPLRFSEVITLYKKILLLSSYSQFLFNNGAKFYPERGQNIDNFKSVTYISQGIHYTRQENTFSPVKITFSHKIEFDDAFENSSIRTDIQFSRWDAPASDQASLVHKSTISLVPFDLAKITQAFGDLITNKRCLAYYNFEIFKLENETGVNSTVSLNDTQKFLLKVSPYLDQNLTTANNTITITIKPSPPMSESYNTYINENAGTKLLFLAQKPKAYEIYEKNKLTLKYASVVDAKVQMQRDIERLENHVKMIGLKKNGLSFMPNSFFEQEEAENNIGVFKQELHSYSLYMLTNNIMLRFYYDKLFDLQPTRLQPMKAYPDGGMKYEKDPGFSRKLFLREMKQALPLLEFIFDLNEKRIDWMAQIRPTPEQENGQREKTAEDKEKEKMRIIRMAKIIGSYYYINVININPWHYLISDGEYECFGIYCEPPNTLEPQRITETHAFHKPIRDIFNKCNPSAPAMNGAGVNSAHNPQKGALTIKIRNKGDLAAFVYQMTILLIKYSDFVNKSNSATNAAAANSSSS